MAILLHLHGSLALAPFSDFETASLTRGDDLPGFPRVFCPTLHSRKPNTSEGTSAGRPTHGAMTEPSDELAHAREVRRQHAGIVTEPS
jgi:hypothetical protein